MTVFNGQPGPGCYGSPPFISFPAQDRGNSWCSRIALDWVSLVVLEVRHYRDSTRAGALPEMSSIPYCSMRNGE